MKYDLKQSKSTILGLIATLWGAFWIFCWINSINRPGDALFGNLAPLGVITFYIITFPIHIILVYFCAKHISHKFNIFLVTGILTIMSPLLCALAYFIWQLINAAMAFLKFPLNDKVSVIIELLTPLLWIASFIIGYKNAKKLSKSMYKMLLLIGTLCFLLTIVYLPKVNVAVAFIIGSTLFIYIVTLLLTPLVKENKKHKK